MLFTQEIKDNWLLNLKSGKYVQGVGTLHNPIDNTYCCLGVLGACTPGLVNHCTVDSRETDPYDLMRTNFESSTVQKIIETNDRLYNPEKPDYSLVIPLIEALPVH